MINALLRVLPRRIDLLEEYRAFDAQCSIENFLNAYQHTSHMTSYLRYPGPQLCVLLRVFEEIDKLHDLNLGLLAPSHISVEGWRGEGGREGGREGGQNLSDNHYNLRVYMYIFTCTYMYMYKRT